MATETSFYVTGGTLRHDTPSYVERRADTELFEGLTAGEFCYVLTSRQMGKSSLMNRTAARLRAAGTQVVILDLTGIGQNVSAEQWYGGLLDAVGRQLDLEDELEDFWLEHTRLGPLQRWMAAIREVVLPALEAPGGSKVSRLEGSKVERQAASQPSNLQLSKLQPGAARLVIFIDEIDTVRSLPFSTDEFFAGIRECYNRRTQEPLFERLTFCLLGVTTPSDLIRDTRTTPFNIGRRIDLTDFTAAEAAPMRAGLVLGSAEMSGRQEGVARALLDRVLYWTGGHPYLTQRLCRAVAEDPSVQDRAGVDRHCSELFLSSGAQERDDNLTFVRERLLRPPTDEPGRVDLAALLDLYGKVRAGKLVPPDDANPLVDLLHLSGISRVAEAYRPTPYTLHPTPSLVVRNRIYARVFDRAWVRKHMPDAEVQRQRVAYRRGVARAASVATAVVAVIGTLAAATYRAERQAQREKRAAVQQQQIAEREREGNRLRLVGMYVGRGTERLDEGDLLGALPWLMEAFHLDRGRPDRERIHRVRIGFALRHSPKLERMWFRKDAIGPVAFSPDGRHVLIASGDRAELLDAATGQRVGQPMQQPAPIVAAIFSRSGERLLMASVDKDGTARVWDARTGAPIGPAIRSPITVHDGVAAVDMTPDGARVLTAGRDGKTRGTAQVWLASTGRPVGPRVRYEADPIRKAWFLPGGRQILTAASGSARVWDVATGKQSGKGIDFGDPRVASILGLSPDGRLLATGSNREVILWDVATGQQAVQSLPHGYFVTQAAFSSDGRRLATACSDGTARVWDVTTGEPITRPLRQGSEIRFVRFSPDGRRLLTGGKERSVRIWDAALGIPLGSSLPHTATILSADFAPDGRRILVASSDNTVRLWDLASDKLTGQSLPGAAPAWSAAFTSDGRRVATLSGPGLGGSGIVRVWNAASGEPLTGPLELAGGINFRSHFLCFSPDGGRILATGLRNGRVWDVKTGRPLTPLFGGVSEPGIYAPFKPEFSRDGSRVLTLMRSVAGERLYGVWDMTTGKLAGPPFTPGGRIEWTTFTPDGGRVLALSVEAASGAIWQTEWDVESGRLVRHPTKLLTRVPNSSAVRRAADGTLLAVGLGTFSADGRCFFARVQHTVRAWDVVTGRTLPSLLVHGSSASAPVLSPDGARLAILVGDASPGAAAMGAHRVQLYQVSTGQPVAPPLVHGSALWGTNFSRDGRYITTYSADQTVHVWDAMTGEPITPPLTQDGMGIVSEISPDGRHLVTSGEHASLTARLWSLAPDDRAVADVDRLAQLLTGEQIDPLLGLVPVETSTLQAAWSQIRARYPADFACPPERALEWHLWEAKEYERQRQWNAAVFHYDQVLAARPEDREVRSARASAAAAVAHPDSHPARGEGTRRSAR